MPLHIERNGVGLIVIVQNKKPPTPEKLNPAEQTQTILGGAAKFSCSNGGGSIPHPIGITASKQIPIISQPFSSVLLKPFLNGLIRLLDSIKATKSKRFSSFSHLDPIWLDASGLGEIDPNRKRPGFSPADFALFTLWLGFRRWLWQWSRQEPLGLLFGAGFFFVGHGYLPPSLAALYAMSAAW
jgi:hypothetical protein